MEQGEKLHWYDRVPGIAAAIIVILVNALWAFWGLGEMFFEGWWGPWYLKLAYLSLGIVSLILSLLAMRWPRAGGWVLIAIGAAFNLWWWWRDILNGTLTWRRVLGQFPVSGILVLAGLLFLWHARVLGKRRRLGIKPHPAWWRRNLRYLLALGIPLAITVVMLAINLPVVLARQDDGGRAAAVIAGNDGATLVWAPQGPGWNWLQEWGGYPDWQMLALYGLDPLGLDGKNLDDGYDWATQEQMDTYGLCAYLSEDGLSLLDEPHYIWRMPTVAEFAAAHMLHGENAGCTWDGESGTMDCALTPDKETPLWAPDESPVYYWTYDEDGLERAYYVSYNGHVNSQPKDWGNPRHGYRCVKQPGE
jgi:hypothetical protein